ncbi:MAG: hypothetical protein GXP49_08950 [Deltaproteobacteria bacterium]|nr:hypothetical protein [Deltaproteobacteria bacterium]
MSKGMGNNPLKGAALAWLALEKSGLTKDSGFYRELLNDLCLKEEDVSRYIEENKEALLEMIEPVELKQE